MSQRNDDSFFVLLGKFASRRGLSRSERSLIAGILLLLVATFDFFKEPHLNAIKQRMDNVVLPIKVSSSRLIALPKIIDEYVNIKRENESLRLELDALRIKNIVATEANNEVEELRKLVNLKYRSDTFSVMEKFLGHEKSIFSSSILISRTQSSTQEDSIVITPDGVVGIISSVHKDIAKVLPVTCHRIAIPVKSNSGEHLIISGTDKNEMESKEIMSNSVSDLKIGDILYTSGEGGTYTENIPVAKITAIDKTKNTIKADPVANLNKLSFVWIIAPVLKNQEASTD